MRIDESRIALARIIDKIGQLAHRDQGSPREYFRFSLFIVFLLTVERSAKAGGFPAGSKVNVIFQSQSELIDQILFANPKMYKDKRLEALQELFSNLIMYDRNFFSGVDPTFPAITRESSGYIIELFARGDLDASQNMSIKTTPLFDGLLRHYMQSYSSFESTRVDAISIITATLFGEYIDQVIDYFPCSAEPVIQALKARGEPIDLLVGKNNTEFSFEYWMRSLVYGVGEKHLVEGASSSLVYKRNSIGVADSIHAPPKNSEFWPTRMNGYSKERGVPKEFIEDLVFERDGPDYSVVLVPAADIARGGDFRLFMGKLVDSGVVVAVIDLPLGKKERTKWSLWVLRNERTSRCRNFSDEVLFVSTDILRNLGFDDDLSQIFYFTALIVKQVVHWEPSSGPEVNLNASFLEFFLKNFSGGYNDVDGLCRTVSAREILEKGPRLAARNFIKPISRDLYGSGLDTASLYREIEAKEGGNCFYLIGDNGEGKSITLRNLADLYVKKGRQTLAISFGATDRFIFKKSKIENDAFYKYLGGRTSKGGTTSDDLSSEIAFRLVEGNNDARREMFIRLAHNVGFSADYFLIPNLIGGSHFSPNNNLGHVIKIFSNDFRDKELLEEYKNEGAKGKRSYQLGLKRESDDNEIVPFKELSSGEQQILNLISRLVFNAEHGCICLVDEPEISLHVSWQRAIPRILEDIASEFHCDVLVATHSPILISEALQLGANCFSSRSKVISRLEDVPQNSIETVLFECFKTNTVNNREVHERCASLLAKAIQFKNGHIALDKRGEELVEELDSMMAVVQKHRYGPDGEIGRDFEIIGKTRQAINDVLAFSSIEED